MGKNINLTVEEGQIKRRCVVCKKISIYTRKTKPQNCPFCHDIYWDKPEDERNLFVLQDQYILNNRDSITLGKMYLLILVYSRNIIINSVKDDVFLSSEALDERTEDLAATFLEKYLKDNTFKVAYSFGGLLIKLSKGILYNQKTQNNDRNASLDMQIAEKLTIESSPSYFINDPDAKKEYEKRAFAQYESVSNNMIVIELENLIDKIYKRILVSEKRKDSILFLIGLNCFLSKEKISMNDFYCYCGNNTRQLIEKTKMFIRQYLLERRQD